MYNCLLSLKNIYRLLTAEDYPEPSYPVIPRRYLHGGTLMKFWQHVLPQRWFETPHGRVIWRTTGSRNRFHSELCNRRRSFPYYEEYADEILLEFGKEELWQMDRAFAAYLEGRSYRPVYFRRKVRAFLQLASQQDPCLEEESVVWLQNLMEQTAEWKGRPAAADSRMLSALCLHAVAGSAMGNAGIRALYRKEWFSALWPEEQKNGSIRFLTRQNTFHHTAGDDHAMYGRETQFFDLKEILREGGRVLICGPGGIGKTLLLDRLLACFKENRRYRQIAVVSCGDSLKESFSRSFTGLMGLNVEERFHEALYLLSEDGGKETLLLIDDLKIKALTQEEREALCSLPCCVAVTSREGRMDGFVPYLLESVELSAAMLIFRHFYRHRLSPAELEELAKLFRKYSMTYPLLLRFLGESMGSGHLSVGETAKLLSGQGDRDEPEGRHYESPLQPLFSRIYQRGQMPGQQEQILRLLALLPYAPYDETWLRTVLEKDADVDTALQELCSVGWLEKASSGYVLHPVLAESVAAAGITEHDLDAVWIRAKRRYTGERLLSMSMRIVGLGKNAIHQEADEEEMEYLFRLVFAGLHLTGPVSGELLYLLAWGAYILMEGGLAGLPTLRRLKKKAAMCADQDSKAALAVALCRLFFQDMKSEQLCQIMLQNHIPDTEPLYLICFLNMIAAGASTQGTDQAEQYVDQAMLKTDEGVFPEQSRIFLLIHRGSIRKLQGRFPEALADFEEALERLEQKHDKAEMILCLVPMAEIYAYLQQEPLADEALDRAGELITDDLRWDYVAFYENASAWRAGQKGDWENAVISSRTVCRLTERYMGRFSLNYVVALSNLGVICSRYGRTRDSRRYHEEALSIMRRIGTPKTQKAMVLNNAAVACLESGRPEEAQTLLSEAARIVPDLGELDMAENRYNLSRCMRFLQDPAGEEENLRACLAVFEKIYGTEHDKTVYVRERLKELQTLREDA